MTADYPKARTLGIVAGARALVDVEIAARAWIEVAGTVPADRGELLDDAFSRGYNSALRSCGERVLELIAEHHELEEADSAGT